MRLPDDGDGLAFIADPSEGTEYTTVVECYKRCYALTSKEGRSQLKQLATLKMEKTAVKHENKWIHSNISKTFNVGNWA